MGVAEIDAGVGRDGEGGRHIVREVRPRLVEVDVIDLLQRRGEEGWVPPIDGVRERRRPRVGNPLAVQRALFPSPAQATLQAECIGEVERSAPERREAGIAMVEHG